VPVQGRGLCWHHPLQLQQMRPPNPQQHPCFLVSALVQVQE
jgi:hypothetical protein